jgi:hypothetical protein
MHPAISYELATARIADLRRQAQRDALAGTAAPVPSSASQPARNRIPVGLHHAGHPRRFGQQLWTLLRGQVLLDGPAAAAGSPRLTEGSYRQFAARRESREAVEECIRQLCQADREEANGKEGVSRS